MSDCLDAPKPPQIGIASILRPVPRLPDSPTNANLPLMPLDAITPAMQIDPIVAGERCRTVSQAAAQAE